MFDLFEPTLPSLLNMVFYSRRVPYPTAGAFQKLTKLESLRGIGPFDSPEGVAALELSILWSPTYSDDIQNTFTQCQPREACLGGRWWSLAAFEAKKRDAQLAGRIAPDDIDIAAFLSLQCKRGYVNTVDQANTVSPQSPHVLPHVPHGVG